MINVVSLEVRSFSLEFLDLSWQIANTVEDISGYTFKAQRSESPQGPFEDVSKDLSETFAFRDDTVDLASKWRVFYYRIEVTRLATQALEEIKGYSAVACRGFRPDLEAMEISRLHQVLLQSCIGVPVVIMKRRTSGPSCPFCFDAVRKRAVDSDCRICLGTSQYRGGFLDPIGTFVNISPSQKVLRVSSITESEPSEKAFDMSGYPLMNPGDLIIDPENRRFVVAQVRNRSKRGFVYRQVLQVSEIPAGDIVYKLPVEFSMFPTPEGELWPRPAQYGLMYLNARKAPTDGYI